MRTWIWAGMWAGPWESRSIGWWHFTCILGRPIWRWMRSSTIIVNKVWISRSYRFSARHLVNYCRLVVESTRQSVNAVCTNHTKVLRTSPRLLSRLGEVPKNVEEPLNVRKCRWIWLGLTEEEPVRATSVEKGFRCTHTRLLRDWFITGLLRPGRNGLFHTLTLFFSINLYNLFL